MNRLRTALFAAACLPLFSFNVQASEGWGSADDAAYAKQLWDALLEAKLVGPECIVNAPYKGTHPHGKVLDTVRANVTIDGHTGIAIVKRNFGGKGVTPEAVAAEPAKYFGAHTIMYKREAGYDPDNADWFYTRQNAEGKPTNRSGKPMAGKLETACIACHRAAPGGDFLFLEN